MDLNRSGELVKLMNTHITGEQTFMYVVNYLDRESGTINDLVLIKLSSGFFAGIPEPALFRQIPEYRRHVRNISSGQSINDENFTVHTSMKLH